MGLSVVHHRLHKNKKTRSVLYWFDSEVEITPAGGDDKFITQHCSIFKTPSGYVQQVPQVSIAQQNLKIMQSLAGEFGLSPATRSRIIAAGGMGDKVSDDPMEQLLNGAWKEG